MLQYHIVTLLAPAYYIVACIWTCVSCTCIFTAVVLICPRSRNCYKRIWLITRYLCRWWRSSQLVMCWMWPPTAQTISKRILSSIWESVWLTLAVKNWSHISLKHLPILVWYMYTVHVLWCIRIVTPSPYLHTVIHCYTIIIFSSITLQ